MSNSELLEQPPLKMDFPKFYKELEAEFLGACAKRIGIQLLQLDLRLGKSPSRSFRPVKSGWKKLDGRSRTEEAGRKRLNKRGWMEEAGRKYHFKTQMTTRDSEESSRSTRRKYASTNWRHPWDTLFNLPRLNDVSSIIPSGRVPSVPFSYGYRGATRALHRPFGSYNPDPTLRSRSCKDKNDPCGLSHCRPDVPSTALNPTLRQEKDTCGRSFCLPPATSTTSNLPPATSTTSNLPSATSTTSNLPPATSLTSQLPPATSLTSNLLPSISTTRASNINEADLFVVLVIGEENLLIEAEIKELDDVTMNEEVEGNVNLEPGKSDMRHVNHI
nr:hypothetical protein [Tanacetum cinerariifolium]